MSGRICQLHRTAGDRLHVVFMKDGKVVEILPAFVSSVGKHCFNWIDNGRLPGDRDHLPARTESDSLPERRELGPNPIW